MAIWLKKKLMLTALRAFLSFGATFADDCHLFNEGNPYLENYKNQLAPLHIWNKEKENIILNVIPQSTLETAFRNLHASCCASNRSSETICNKKGSLENRKKRKNFPESNYLFDHLIDVQLRRWLNSNTGDESYPNFLADQQAKERYENMEKIIKQAEGVLPTKLNKDYQKYRGIQPDFLLPWYQGGNTIEYRNLLEDISQEQNTETRNNQKKIKEFKQRNLRTKLLNTCPTASYLSIILSPRQDLTSSLQAVQENCKKLTEEQLNQQNTMLKQAITFKSDRLTTDTLKNYANYFSKRLSHLQTQIVETTTKLQGTMRQIPQLQPRCN